MTMPVEPGHSQARPSILERGFRPFFFGAAVFAAVAIPLWVAMLRLGWMPPAALDGRQWHVPAMLFGFLTGVIGGVLLAAHPESNRPRPHARPPPGRLFCPLFDRPGRLVLFLVP